MDSLSLAINDINAHINVCLNKKYYKTQLNHLIKVWKKWQ